MIVAPDNTAAVRQLTIVFDLDGTLAHTAPDIVRSLNTALVEHGVPAIDVPKGIAMIGAGARVLVERALFELRGVPVTEDEREHIVARFIVHYADAIKVDSALYPGVLEALDALRERGHRLAICTNKPEHLARLLVDALGIADRFDALAGIDTYAWKKPDGRHIASTVEAAGGDPRHAVMVGDSHFDVYAARDAGVPVVAVSFGYSDKPVVEYEPDVVIDHYDALVGAVEALASFSGSTVIPAKAGIQS